MSIENSNSNNGMAGDKCPKCGAVKVFSALFCPACGTYYSEAAKNTASPAVNTFDPNASFSAYKKSLEPKEDTPVENADSSSQETAASQGETTVLSDIAELDKPVELDPISKKIQEMARQNNTSGPANAQNASTSYGSYTGMTNQGMANSGMLNQGMPNSGTPNPGVYIPGASNQNMYNQGASNTSMYNRGTSAVGTYGQGTSNQGTYGQGAPNPGVYIPGASNQSMPNQGVYTPGAQNGGMPNSGAGYQGQAAGNGYGGYNNYQSPYMGSTYGVPMPEEKKSKAGKIFAAVIILALLALVGYGAYRYFNCDKNENGVAYSVGNAQNGFYVNDWAEIKIELDDEIQNYTPLVYSASLKSTINNLNASLKNMDAEIEANFMGAREFKSGNQSVPVPAIVMFTISDNSFTSKIMGADLDKLFNDITLSNTGVNSNYSFKQFDDMVLCGHSYRTYCLSVPYDETGNMDMYLCARAVGNRIILFYFYDIPGYFNISTIKKHFVN